LNEDIDCSDFEKAVREGMKDMEEGRVYDARTALEALGRELDL
jgi:predicted transcriptional regulator